MTLSRETVMAFIDGELASDERAQVARAMEDDIALRAYVEQQKALKGQLQADFAPILREPLPKNLVRQLAHVSKTVASSRARQPSRSGRLFGAMSAGIERLWIPAATAVAGIALGIVLAPSVSPQEIANENGRLLARGELAAVLSTQLASQQSAGAEIGIAVTFQHHQGALCRTFLDNRSVPGLAGIACYDDDEWRIEMLAYTSDSTESGGYQRANAAMPPAMRETVGAMIAGEPLDADQERSARESGWLAP